MPDIYKHGYDNFKKITVLFILQIILGVLPVVLLVIYIGFSLYSNVVLGYTFIVIMAIAAALNFTITKRYNVGWNTSFSRRLFPCLPANG